MVTVSCIMPTTFSRINFIPMAIHRFLSQDYPDAELIILDDGEKEGIALLTSGMANVRYIRHSRKFSSVGSKRNFACSLAKGDIILHWDDDDWYASDWISFQVNVLVRNNADICGLNNVYFYQPGTERAWQYVYNANRRSWVAGATMAYKKSHWERHPFKNINVGEDNDFVWYSKAVVVPQPYHDGFVSILHQNNTSPKLFETDKQWKPAPATKIEKIIGEDFDFYSYLLNATRNPNNGA